MHLRLATRGSPLALHQAGIVGLRLAAAGHTWEPVVVSTRGDQMRDRSSEEIPGGPGVFTKEVEDAVLDGRADAAVHSAKDLPTATVDGLTIAAVPERADPRDALVGSALTDLPHGAIVATDSARRRAQLLWLRPDLRFTLLRGNVGTRIERLGGDVDALVLAMAGLARLGLSTREDVHPLAPDDMVPAMGQGALAVECRSDDGETQRVLSAIDDRERHREVAAERLAIATLGGGCTAAVGALCRGEEIVIVALKRDGTERCRVSGRPHDAVELARVVLARGAREWLGQ